MRAGGNAVRTAPKIVVSATLMLGLVTAVAGAAKAQGNTTYRWGSLFGEAEKTQPTVVGFLSDVTAIAAGNSSSVALDGQGHVWTWGLGADYVLGRSNKANHTASAVEVPGIPPAVAIAESYNTDVAITASGAVYGWGDSGGALCTGNTNKVRRPERLTALNHVVMAAGAGGHMLYLLADGTLKTCGNNVDGQLGDGTLNPSYVPVTVTGLPPSRIVALSAGWRDSTVLLANGQVWDWGFNQSGNLGDGVTADSDVPVKADLPSAAKEIYQGGSDHQNGQSLALLSNGQVWGWGNNSYGQLGDGGTKLVNPTPGRVSNVPTGVTFSYVVSGGATSYGLDTKRNVWAWGASSTGQIGNGVVRGHVLTPVKVLSGATLISSTADNTVAVTG